MALPTWRFGCTHRSENRSPSSDGSGPERMGQILPLVLEVSMTRSGIDDGRCGDRRVAVGDFGGTRL
eukprot:scaffold35770_cov101-Isochrysis_galbana.AAC.1